MMKKTRIIGAFKKINLVFNIYIINRKKLLIYAITITLVDLFLNVMIITVIIHQFKTITKILIS